MAKVKKDYNIQVTTAREINGNVLSHAISTRALGIKAVQLIVDNKNGKLFLQAIGKAIADEIDNVKARAGENYKRVKEGQLPLDNVNGQTVQTIRRFWNNTASEGAKEINSSWKLFFDKTGFSIVEASVATARKEQEAEKATAKEAVQKEAVQAETSAREENKKLIKEREKLLARITKLEAENAKLKEQVKVLTPFKKYQRMAEQAGSKLAEERTITARMAGTIQRLEQQLAEATATA